MFTLSHSSPIAAAFLRTSMALVPPSIYREQRTTVLSAQNALPHHVPDPPLGPARTHMAIDQLDNTPRITSYAPSVL